MPNWKYYISIGYRISNEYYGGEDMKLAGTGQGNKFSRDICCNMSYLMIRKLEKEDLGMKVKSLYTKKL